MTRVVRGARLANASQMVKRATRGTLRKHKVILESVTQEKKKLRTVVSFEASAPEGFTFIPAGNPHLTSACKDMCRKDGLRIFAVSTTPHQRAHNLSQQVHRIGYHFPSAVVANACMQLGLYLNANGKAMPFESFSSIKADERAGSEASQTTINTEARDVIRDLFPNIPEQDINMIITTAFQKGQRKVGTAAELPLTRRAQLAVVAHIRHVYTDYDKLLKKTTFPEARRMVETPTLERLVEWRGDDENGKTELEDVFREVIVISDDEDSDTDQEEDDVTSSHRHSSVEIISHDAKSTELNSQSVDYACPTQDIFEEETSQPGFPVFSGTNRKARVTQAKIDRRGFSRYKVWEQARHQWRERRTSPNQNRESRRPQDKPSSVSSQRHPRRTFSASGTIQDSTRVVTRGHNLNRYYQVSRAGQTTPSTSLRDNFDLPRGSERGSIDGGHLPGEAPTTHRPTHTIRPVLVRNTVTTRPIEMFQPQGSLLAPVPYPEEMNYRKRRYTPDPLHHSRSYDEINHPIIPSIENPSFSPRDEPITAYHDLPSHINVGEPQARSPRRRHVEECLSRRLEVIDLTGNDNADHLKKRRLDHPSILLPSPLEFESLHPPRPGYAKSVHVDTDRPRDIVPAQEEQAALRGNPYRPDGNRKHVVLKTPDPTLVDRTSHGRHFPPFSSKTHIGMTKTQEEARYSPYGYHQATSPMHSGRYITEPTYNHAIPERVIRSVHAEENMRKNGSRLLESPNSSLTPSLGHDRPASSTLMEPNFSGNFSSRTNPTVRPLNVAENFAGEPLSVDFRNGRTPYVQEGRSSQSSQNHESTFFAGDTLTNSRPLDLVGEDPSQYRHSGGQLASHNMVARTERSLNLPRNSPLGSGRNTRLPASAVKRYMSQKEVSQDLPRFEVDQYGVARDADRGLFLPPRHDGKPSRHSADPYRRDPIISVD